MHIYSFFRKVKGLNYNDMIEGESILITKNTESFTIDMLKDDKIEKTIYSNLKELLTRDFLVNELNFKIDNNRILNFKEMISHV